MTDWLDFAVVMLSSAGVSVALTAALVWLLRSWISERVRGAIQAEYAEKLETLKAQLKAEADLKLETYRATLKGQADVELEKLRASLAIAAAQRNAQAGYLLQRRFEAIAAVHGHLLRVHGVGQARLHQLKTSAGPDSDGYNQDEEVSRVFRAAYEDWRIFLPKRTTDRIDAIRKDLITGSALVSTALRFENPDVRRHLQKWTESFGRELWAAIEQLEAELRALMGDEPDPAPSASGASMPEGE